MRIIAPLLKSIGILSSAFLLVIPPLAFAIDQRADALKLINSEAEKICYSIPQSSSTSSFEISGSAAAKLSGLTEKLANLGVSGAAKYSTSTSQGILQQQLALALKTSSECKLTIFKILERDFLHPGPYSLTGLPHQPLRQNSKIVANDRITSGSAHKNAGILTSPGDLPPEPAQRSTATTSLSDDCPGSENAIIRIPPGAPASVNNVGIIGDGISQGVYVCPPKAGTMPTGPGPTITDNWSFNNSVGVSIPRDAPGTVSRNISYNGIIGVEERDAPQNIPILTPAKSFLTEYDRDQRKDEIDKIDGIFSIIVDREVAIAEKWRDKLQGSDLGGRAYDLSSPLAFAENGPQEAVAEIETLQKKYPAYSDIGDTSGLSAMAEGYAAISIYFRRFKDDPPASASYWRIIKEIPEIQSFFISVANFENWNRAAKRKIVAQRQELLH